MMIAVNNFCNYLPDYLSLPLILTLVMQEAMLDTVTTAIVGLLANQGQLRDAIPVMGHIPRLVAALGSPAPQAKHAVRLLHELAQSQQCVEQLCESGDCMAGLRSAINNCPETLDLVAKALNQMFQKDASRLVQQASFKYCIYHMLRNLFHRIKM